ncbi:hypothetical protein GCM10022226_52640 [Sphaerisporangium flaviroseum]|uniref:Uncharacterized protein n=1 Tax=Sphaerisporangium flaviroseum TaxID=509199 RepID=A0ABP7IS03_9ACTN
MPVGVGVGDGSRTDNNTRLIPFGSGRSAETITVLDLDGTVLDRIESADRPGRRHVTPGKTGVPGPGAAEGGTGHPGDKRPGAGHAPGSVSHTVPDRGDPRSPPDLDGGPDPVAVRCGAGGVPSAQAPVSPQA